MRPRHDARLVPAALAAYLVTGTIAAGAVGARVWIVAAVGGAIVLGVGRWRGAGSAWVAILTVALAAVTVALHVNAGRTPIEEVAAEGGDVRLLGTVVFDPRPIAPSPFDRAEPRVLVELRLNGVGHPSETPTVAHATVAIVAGSTWVGLRAGDRVEATARLEILPPGRVVAIAWNPRLDAVTEARGIDACVASLRDQFREATWSLPSDVRALTVGMTIGDTAGMSSTQRHELRVAGLTHLTAVSGAQFAMLALAVGAAFRALGWNRRWRVVALGLVMAGFVALVQPEPSVLRAAWMGGVFAVALWWGRPGQALPALATAVIGLLLADPFLALAAGFALSVAATAAIVLWAPVLAVRLVRVVPPRLARAFAVPFAAQVACTPILILFNPGIGPYGVIANLLAMPFAVLVTALGLASVAVTPVWEAGGVLLARAAGAVARPVAVIAHDVAGLPASWLPWPPGPVGAALAAAVAASLIVATSARRTVGWVRLGVLVATLALVAASPPMRASIAEATRRAPGDWVFAACDVGQGDAILIRAGPGSAVVVDTGPDGAGVAACLMRHGVADVPLLILTHPHTDHDGGLDEVLAHSTVGEAWVSSARDAERERNVLASAGVAVSTPTPGTSVAVGRARLSVWHSEAGDERTESGVNDGSLVVWGEVGGLTFLALGDLEAEGQLAFDHSVGTRSVDIVKVAHHGSPRQDAGFIAAASVGALVIVSVGADNPYGHPATETLTLLESVGATVFRTDECRDVDVSNRDRIVVTSSCA